MCKRADCPTPEKSRFVRSIDEVKDNPMYTPGTDDFPDGFHAKPMRLWIKKPQKKRALPSLSEDEISRKRLALDEEYAALPEPKPDYMDWASYKTRHDQFWQAYTILTTSPYLAERVKALSFLAEFTKTKPKQQFEVANIDLKNLDNVRLLEEVLELNGLPRSLAQELKLPGEGKQ